MTGARIEPSEQKASGLSVSAKAARQNEPYASFLSQLQAAVSANDRNAIVRLIALPLRVNSQGAPRYYRDADSVERDFNRIFTRKVRRAILGQKPTRLFVRNTGARVGAGEVWFSGTCPNAACSPAGPVRIIAVNP